MDHHLFNFPILLKILSNVFSIPQSYLHLKKYSELIHIRMRGNQYTIWNLFGIKSILRYFTAIVKINTNFNLGMNN